MGVWRFAHILVPSTAHPIKKICASKGEKILKIVSVEQRLKEAGLDRPRLNALQADDTLYTVLAHQPLGRICIAEDSIGHANPAAAKQRTQSLIRLAGSLENQPDLLVSPEYSVPWDALLECIEEDIAPERGKLWVLGCESLLLGGLATIRDRLDGRAIVLDDDISPIERTTQRYRNPLVYVFRTKVTADQTEQLVLLVQYKTVVSGDPGNTEAAGMLPGSIVYAFGNPPEEIRLITLICSDVFGFEKSQVDSYYDGLLLLHIQLNNSPRHLIYKKYRPELFAAAGRTELLCLNWAEKVVSIDSTTHNEHEWNNIGGSAWYLLSPEIDLSDEAIRKNHLNGIYYTRHEPIRAHALQFHYQPRVFLFQATKVFHHAIPKPRSTRSGPQALKSFVWAPDLESWVEPRNPNEFANDGFCDHLSKVSGGDVALDDIQELYRIGPMAVERAMAVTAGQFGIRSEWFAPSRLDSMQLCEQEVVRRVTVIQDPAAEAIQFRSLRFSAIRAIGELRNVGYRWPAPLEALRHGFKFSWSHGHPHRNVIAADGTLATVVYAGLLGDPQGLERLEQQVRKALAGPPPEPERMLSQEQEKQFVRQHWATAAQRFCILYATATGTKHYLSERGASFTRPAGQSDVDIGVPSFYKITGTPHGTQR